ncbi:tetratricopeptide repeat protein [Micromonospora sp. RTGN7]|uniref:tetratricopeptide repeat protein n=1 Tax=Micromonospora sp. RTGN7 TaxID=3016526 RepID=UPI0029FF1B02|nr:tetratricopeptide repeat protein [Micromonospora sp. RTGN7]
MSSAFGELTVQAHHLVSAGDLAGAQQLLSEALSDADPRPDQASPELADAAGLQARVLIALGEPHSARGWAAFAYAATTRLHGRSDPRTVSSAATLAAVLHRVGSHARAARLYSDVVIELTASDGPESLRVLAAHADLATVEYARGQCEVARERLQDAWELHREVYGDGHPSGIKMLARLGSMQRDCGEFAEAHDHLALARELCLQHLAVDDPLAVQVAALARAAANPDHVCAGAPRAVRNAPAAPPDVPVIPAARVPPAAEGPPAYPPEWPLDDPAEGSPTYPPAWPLDDPSPHTVPAPRMPPEDAASPAAPGTPTAFPAADDGWPPEGMDDDPWIREHAAPNTPTHLGGDRWTGRDEARDSPAYPEEHDRWTGRDDARDTPTYPEEHDRWTGRDEARDTPTYPEEHDRWTGRDEARDTPTYPEEHDRWPREPEQPAEGALPPTAVGLAGSVEAEPAGVRATRLPAVRQDRSRLLPVLVPRPPAPPPRRLTPLVVVGGVTVVVLGTAAVVAGVSRVDGPGQAPSPSPTVSPVSDAPGAPGSSAPASPRAAASPGTPPGRFTLRDNRDNIALNWTYPAGASGPVVLAGAPSGQEPRAFETLPAGSTSWLVHGLDTTNDYCFTIAVVWAADTVGRTRQVCTRRR